MCDLYAGIGSMGIEALSRGAGNVTFVESNPAAVKVLENNLERIRSDKTVIILEEVERYLASTTDTFDVVIADPPYGQITWEQLWSAAGGKVRAGGCMVMEMEERAPLPGGVDVRRYGRTKVAIWRHNR